MRKLLFILIVCTSFTNLHAQSKKDNYDIYKGIENSSDIALKRDQVAKIKKIKREYGQKFAAIGKDRSLTGYEKGQKKRALSKELNSEIRKILSKDQIYKWDKRYGNRYDYNDMKDAISDKYEDQLDALEDRYEARKEAIEDNPSLSKETKKKRLKALKAEYKADKEILKQKKKKAEARYDLD